MKSYILPSTFAVLIALGCWSVLPVQAEDRKAAVQPAAVETTVVVDHAGCIACAKICSDCQLQCDMCFAYCNGMTAKGLKGHEKTAQLCVDCADCCKLAATLTARTSLLSADACECCAKCCDKCAEACEKIDDDKHMHECAKSCRDCAKACRAMTQTAGK
ncbi:hypothetical protein [Limnoglobus roseus]|uniref:Four-helix bundle copper-binding protein n=1 Tax=Limnoglobus roseus TaxID=2598579 RepID=A0A5C1ALN9_9BACT|nr:hypothetical protein [Limnoglobus roseus]QEL19880.1 four-helix bundle copper-binding protein [Limnoglobus roseus]